MKVAKEDVQKLVTVHCGPLKVWVRRDVKAQPLLPKLRLLESSGYTVWPAPPPLPPFFTPWGSLFSSMCLRLPRVPLKLF